MDFIIIYERKIRELENALLLKLELEKRGYLCGVYQYYEGIKYNILNNNSPKVILIPHLYNERDIYRNFAKFGSAEHLVNLQYEQVLSERWERVGHHNPKGEAKNAVHVCWGTKTRDRLKEAGVPINNIKVLGALQLDLLRKEYRKKSAYVKKELGQAFKLDVTKRWTLFISSFTYADISEDRLKMNESVANVDLGNFVKLHTNSRNQILDWLKKILGQDKDNLIIYRPHPDELNLNKVIELEKTYLNFKIIREQPVKVWIESSDNIYSWYSTSIVESHFLDKPYSILRPIELPNDFDSVLLKHAQFITEYNKFEQDFIKDDSTREMPIDDSYIRQYYQVDDSYPSYKKYCDMLEEVYKSDTKQSYNIKLIDKITSKIKTLAVIVINIIYKISKLDLEKYKRRNKNGFLISWLIEMDNQIASDAEKKKIEEKLKKTVFDEENCFGGENL